MPTMICSNCGTAGEPKQTTKGSTGVELLLWLFFLIPGLIYSLWRLGSKYDACADCMSSQLLPPNSPIGRKIARESGVDLEEIEAVAGAASLRRGRIYLAVILIAGVLFGIGILT